MLNASAPRKRYMMMLGPVQLMVIGLHDEDDDFEGKVPMALHAAHMVLGALRHEHIRVLDMVMVRKDARGDVQLLQVGALGEPERAFSGALASDLLGLRAGGNVAPNPQARYGVLTVARREFGLTEADLREIVQDIPNGKAAAIVLVEHLWVVRLKEAFEHVGCTFIAEGMLTSGILGVFGADVAIAQIAADNDYVH